LIASRTSRRRGRRPSSREPFRQKRGSRRARHSESFYGRLQLLVSQHVRCIPSAVRGLSFSRIQPDQVGDSRLRIDAERRLFGANALSPDAEALSSKSSTFVLPCPGKEVYGGGGFSFGVVQHSRRNRLQIRFFRACFAVCPVLNWSNQHHLHFASFTPKRAYDTSAAISPCYRSRGGATQDILHCEGASLPANIVGQEVAHDNLVRVSGSSTSAGRWSDSVLFFCQDFTLRLNRCIYVLASSIALRSMVC